MTLSFIRSAAMAGALSTFAICSNASSLFLYSNAVETSNNSGAATMDIAKNPGWAGPLAGSSWVSNVQSGDPSAAGYVVPADGTNVIFSDTFTINGTPTDGILNVLADDTTSVVLNGVTLVSQASSVGNTYSACSDTTIGCLASTEGRVNLSGLLHSGVNTLTFDVAQVHGGSFGVDYVGTVNYTASAAAPEPATFSLLGLPLVGLFLKKRKKA